MVNLGYTVLRPAEALPISLITKLQYLCRQLNSTLFSAPRMLEEVAHPSPISMRCPIPPSWIRCTSPSPSRMVLVMMHTKNRQKGPVQVEVSIVNHSFEHHGWEKRGKNLSVSSLRIHCHTLSEFIQHCLREATVRLRFCIPYIYFVTA